MAEILIERVTKSFGGGVKAVDDVSLRIGDGEFMVLVGPSGCGKSTLLRAIAGLEDVDAGAVIIEGRDVTDLAPRNRDIAMVFQSYALYPHMSVRQNLGYGLKVRKLGKQETEERVERVARLLRLDGLLDRRPAALSGGQRQRVAMGRAIVREPKAFLMDEPLSNLDAKLRVGMRAELASLHQRLRATTVYVTQSGRGDDAGRAGCRDAARPDPAGRYAEEALRRADERLRRLVHRLARDELVHARFDGAAVEFGGHRIEIPAEWRPEVEGGEIVLGIRPEAFEDASSADASLPQFDVEVAVLEDVGADAFVYFRVGATPARVDEHASSSEQDTLMADEGMTFTARVNPATAAQVGEQLRLAVDATSFHYFGPGSGERHARAVRETQAASAS